MIGPRPRLLLRPSLLRAGAHTVGFAGADGLKHGSGCVLSESRGWMSTSTSAVPPTIALLGIVRAGTVSGRLRGAVLVVQCTMLAVKVSTARILIGYGLMSQVRKSALR